MSSSIGSEKLKAEMKVLQAQIISLSKKRELLDSLVCAVHCMGNLRPTDPIFEVLNILQQVNSKQVIFILKADGSFSFHEAFISGSGGFKINAETLVAEGQMKPSRDIEV